MNLSDFWIPVEFGDEETPGHLYRALSVLQETHDWTYDYMAKYQAKHKRVPPYLDVRKAFWRSAKDTSATQSYSVHRVLEKSCVTYTQQAREGIQPQPVEIDWIQIEARKIWRKYLALYGLVTTKYGTIIFLDRADGTSWKEILRRQGGRTKPDLIPFLWHSLTLQTPPAGWRVRFDLHKEHSTQGKKAKEEYQKTYG